MAITAQNKKRTFALNIQEKLNFYVYALQDPRDKKIFYVGEGKGNRLFSHFDEAEKEISSAKTRRINEIWAEEEDVQYMIIRWGIKTQREAQEVEAGIIDSLEASMNGPLLNVIRGQRVSQGIMYPIDLNSLDAQALNVDKSITLFLFPIQNAVGDDKGDLEKVYEATRKLWKVGAQYRNIKNSYAIGLIGGVSYGVFEIDSWKEDSSSEKCYFDKKELVTDNELIESMMNKSFAKVISPAKAHWGFGNHLVCELNDKSEFKIIKGCGDHDWTPLI